MSGHTNRNKRNGVTGAILDHAMARHVSADQRTARNQPKNAVPPAARTPKCRKANRRLRKNSNRRARGAAAPNSAYVANRANTAILAAEQPQVANDDDASLRRASDSS